MLHEILTVLIAMKNASYLSSHFSLGDAAEVQIIIYVYNTHLFSFTDILSNTVVVQEIRKRMN
jgi:hypothetical protein